METTPPGDPQYITVVCPVCGTRLDEVVRDQPRSTRCPDCHTQVPVPAATQIPQPPRPKRLPDVGTYRFQTDADSLSAAAGSAAARRERAMVLVICPLCSARIDTLAGKQSRAVKCPDCYELVRIPSLKEVAARRKPKVKPVAASVESLPVPAPAPRSAQLPTFFADAGARIRREEAALPPRRVFLSGVFGLPWREEVLPRWLYLTFGLIVMNSLVAFLTTVGIQTAGSRFGMVIAFFVLPLFWVATWTLSYAAACCRAILEDTAAGSDRVVSWHEQNWREWVLVLAGLGCLVGITFVLGHLTARLVELAGAPYLPVMLAVGWAAFPIVLLSSLEADSLLLPVSAPVMCSLWRRPGGWLTYYMVSTLIVGGPLLLVVMLAAVGFPVAAALIGAPVIAASVFYYARVIGRLGWLISRPETETATKTRKRSRRRKASL